MRRHSFFAVMICAVSFALMAGRCSDDDKKSAGGKLGGEGALPAAERGSTDAGKVDSGVETDPLGETLGGPDAPLEGSGDLPPSDTFLDDQTFEPQPVPEGAADL